MGALEVYAAAHVLNIRVYIVHESGQVYLFNREGEGSPVVLYYSSSAKHYEWLEGDLEDQLQPRAQGGKPKCDGLHGGAPKRKQPPSVCLSDFASEAAPTPARRGPRAAPAPASSARLTEFESHQAGGLTVFASVPGDTELGHMQLTPSKRHASSVGPPAVGLFQMRALRGLLG